MSKPVIDVKNVSMEFNLNQENTDSLKEFVIRFIKKELHFQSFWALNNVSLKIYQVEKVKYLKLIH